MNTEKYLDNYLKHFNRTRAESLKNHGLSLLPKMKDVENILDYLTELFFPGDLKDISISTLEDEVRYYMQHLSSHLYKQIFIAYRYENGDEDECETRKRTEAVIDSLLQNLGKIRQMIKLDAQAGFDGDPAAKSLHEIILCYPAVRALTVHRVAHHLYKEGVPLIPRMMNEIIHRETGMDIHPGAEIGKSFFVDHGTGVVIGETTVIGDNVKLYQGVTLGALSFPKDGCGALIRGTKRHPTIKNNVTIYANATILGDITIGENSVIGSSAWITRDIEDNSRVLPKDPEIIITQRHSLRTRD
ncbi:MAG: serine acetyltransferase [Sphaerochaetaceae bacterium]|nr:serine acetyltransferase [Sphaerochaetaceae bacterium]